jgi:hypothetical protein
VSEAAAQSATPAPAPGEATSTEKVGGDLITHDTMKAFIAKRAKERGETVEDDEEKPKVEAKKAPIAEKPADEEGQADEPKADPKFKELEAKAKEYEAKVQHFEQREAKWSEVTDKLIAQRDYFKAIAEQVEGALPDLGYEIDPTARENAALKAQLREFTAAQERQRAQMEARQRQQQEAEIRSYRDGVLSTGQRLAQSYPELNPATNPELASAFFRGWAAKGGDAQDLERAAMAYVKKIRGMNPNQAQRAPNTLGGSRAPGAPLPVGRDWSDIRKWAQTRHGSR